MRRLMVVIFLISSLTAESYIYPLTKCISATSYSESYCKARVWIEEDITNYNKTPVIKKTRYILDGNWYDKVNDNEYSLKWSDSKSTKIFERIYFDSRKATISTVYRSGKTDTVQYDVHNSVLH